MRVAVIIQARTGSSRLPGKVLMDLGGLPVLSWVIRAALAAEVDSVIVATTTAPADDAIRDLAREWDVPVVRGSEEDVLSRYVQAVREHPADAIVRITSDCPMTDPRLIDLVVGTWRACPEYDYVSTVLHRTLPHGLDVELVTARALLAVDATARGHDRVHVTSALYAAASGFNVLGLTFAPDATDLRVTLDTDPDLIALRALVSLRGTGVAERHEVIGVLRANPEVAAINASVVQKQLAEG